MKSKRWTSDILDHEAAAFATAVFGCHLIYLLFIQLQNALALRGPEIVTIAGHQFQTIVASAVVCATYLCCRKFMATKLAFYCLFTSLLFLYATSGIYFRMFREPFSLSSVEGFSLEEAPRYWGSFVAELGAADYFNYTLALAIGILLLWLDRRRATGIIAPKNRRLAVRATAAAAIALCVISGLTGADSKAAAVTKYPLLTLIEDVGADPVSGPASPLRTMTREQFYKLQFGVASSDEKQKAILAKDRAILQSRKRNVVFIILESVGSRQLLENGVPRKDVAPFLHAQTDKSIIFNNLPTVFPGSTRSHVALNTGGNTLTWGSVYTALPHKYEGQTLASAFKADGRPTALYSAGGLNFENLNMFYANLGYDERFEPDALPNEIRKQKATHSWGIDERLVASKAVEWATSVKEPFFLTFLNVITHHPYGAPSDYKSPFPSDDNQDKYKTAIHFTDSVIEKLVEDLKGSGLSDDTVLFIVGDHGEAFGDIHEDNLLHRSHLYEENIRDFLMIVDLSGEIEPLQSSIGGSAADVMPTILDSQSIKPGDEVVGQSLLSPGYTERMAFFQKNSVPEKWGLRDGKWKFFVDKEGSKNPELYDLEADPSEQINLATQHMDRVAGYVDRISNWYIQINDGFVSRLKGFEYEGARSLTVADVTQPGPKRIAIGRKLSNLPFEPLRGDINPAEDIVVWTSGPAYSATKTIKYVFTSPSGQKHSFDFEYDKEWSEAWVQDDPPKPREEGQWTVQLFDGDKEIIETSFNVSSGAPLYWSHFDRAPGVREIFIGVKPKDDNFHVLPSVNPWESVMALVQSVPYQTDRRLDFLWIAPDDSFESFDFTQKAGWNTSWVSRTPDGPMTPGTWRVEIWMDGEFKIGQNFNVSEDAPLYTPIAEKLAKIN